MIVHSRNESVIQSFCNADVHFSEMKIISIRLDVLDKILFSKKEDFNARLNLIVTCQRRQAKLLLITKREYSSTFDVTFHYHRKISAGGMLQTIFRKFLFLCIGRSHITLHVVMKFTKLLN